jgi:chromosome segregation ATPase
MEQKARFILFGLVGIIIVSFVFLAQTMNAKQQVERERDGLAKEKSMLEGKVESLEVRVRESDKKVASLNSDLRKVSQEKEDLQSKYDLANRAKEELVEKLKETRSSISVSQVRPAAAVPETNDAYWGSILQAKLNLEMQITKVRSELKATLITNEQLQREKSSLELGLNSLKRENEDSKRQMEYNKKTLERQMEFDKKELEKKLEDTKRIMDRISQDLVTEKNDKMKIQESFKVVKNENTALIRQIENLNSRKIDLEQRLKQIQEDKVSLERKFHDMEAVLNDNITQVSALKNKLEARPEGVAQKQQAPVSKGGSVELPAIVVRPQGTGLALSRQPAAGSVGQVLAINKEGNFVIINMGEDAGVKVGDMFSVYREGQRIATLEVIRPSKSVTACDIKKQALPIRIGDFVK